MIALVKAAPKGSPLYLPITQYLPGFLLVQFPLK